MQTQEISVNSVAYDLLVSMGPASKSAEKDLQAAKADQAGAMLIAIRAARVIQEAHADAAIACAVFLATIDSLMDGIRRNVGGLAVKFGATKRTKASKNGEKYKVPQSVSNARSELKYAFENAVALVDKDGEPRSFKSVKDENAASRTVKRDAIADALTGDAAIKRDALRAHARLADWLKSAARTSAEFKEFALFAEVLMTPTAALASAAAQPQATPTVATATPTVETSETPPATARKRSRKAA